MSESPSSLPPLDPNGRNSSSAPKLKKTAMSSLSKSLNYTDINIQHLKREVQRISPRIQSIEREVNTIRQQVPIGMSNSIAQILTEMNRLSKKYLSHEDMTQGSIQIEEADNAERIKALESRIKVKLEQALDTTMFNLKRRLREQKESSDKLSTPTFNIELENNEDTYDEQIETLDHQIKSNTNRSQKRLDHIDTLIANLSSISTNKSDHNDRIKQISADIDIHRGEITDIRSQIAELKSIIKEQKQQAAQRAVEISTEGDEQRAPTSFMEKLNLPPDLTEPLNDLREEITEANHEFTNQMNELKKNTDECEEGMREMDSLILSLVTSSSNIQSHITELSHLYTTLQSKVGVITDKMGTGPNQEKLDDLKLKMTESHNKLKDDIDVLKKMISDTAGVAKPASKPVLSFQNNVQSFDTEKEESTDIRPEENSSNAETEE